jgi:hypothetical protein
MLPTDQYESSGVQNFTHRAPCILEKAWNMDYIVKSDPINTGFDI